MEELLFSMALSVLLATVKNPEKVKKLKGALRKLRDVLITLPLDA